MKKIFTLLITVLVAFVGLGQIKDRPKVGLVLSGGGAKGLAHIGVLKVLEEQGVQIDYITGTSMGAIIGGLYASGYTSSELDSIFRQIDADALISDYVPRISKSFYEKKNDEIYALTLPFKNFKIGLPQALSRGMYNYNLMNKLLAHVRHVNDFKELNVPFLCIATNIETGEAVLLDKGYLPQVILASGAFPSLFSPVYIDGKYLIDGGIVNNYPIKELRNLGADIVIGVDVQDGLKNMDNIDGAGDILLQISNYSTINQMKNKLAETDIYIKPDISGYKVTSFDQGAVIIQRGIDAATEKIEQLKEIGGVENVLEKQFVPKYQDKLNIDHINIDGLNRYTRRYIYGKLGFKPNSTISFLELEEGIGRLNGTDNFSSISYQFKKSESEDNADDLELSLTENRIKRYLRFGVHYDGLYKTAALVNVTEKNLFLKSDVASLDVALGDNLRYNFNYFVDNGFYWSVGISSKYNKFHNNMPYKPLLDKGFIHASETSNRISTPRNFGVDYKELENRLYFQTFYKQKALFTIGAEHRLIDISSSSLNIEQTQLDKSNYLGAFVNFTLDTYDNMYFPRKGFMFKGEYKNYLFSSNNKEDFQNFSVISGQIGYATKLFKKFSLDLKSRMGTIIGTSPSVGFEYFLGGYGFAERDNIIPFFGYNFLQITGDSFISGTLSVDYEFVKRHHLNLGVNLANVGDNIFTDMEWLLQSQYTGYSLGYGMQTMIGPIEAKFTYNPERGSSYTFVSVGFWF